MGGNTIYVRRSLVRTIFGQRKFSFADWLASKGPDDRVDRVDREGYRRTMTALFDMIVPATHKIENNWQEVVRLAKDAIVIKTGVVLGGNIMSNNLLLKILGVSLKDIAKDQASAVVAIKQYQRDAQELDKLERSIRVNPNLPNRKQATARVAQLQDSIAHSEIKELLDAGVFQSIVEDIDNLEDQQSYPTQLERLIEPIKQRSPELLNKVASQVFITHETGLYKFLRDATQLSDFVARYALHQHNVNNKGMSSTDSIDMITDIFINYDLPTHKGIQYANDIGAFMFSKFMIRIQKVIFHTLTKHPARTLAVLTVNDFLGIDSPYITDSIQTGPDDLWDRLANPFDIIESTVDTVTINAASDML